MNYLEMKQVARTGDLVLCKDRTLIGILIRIFTAESFNHVAVLVWLDKGLWIAEMTSHAGFNLVPASEWFEARRNSELLYCQAPGSVHKEEEIILKKIFMARSRKYRYSFLTLVRVWFSQIFNRHINGLLVCSTFAQDLWESTGFSRFKRLADPGDLLLLSWRSFPITKETSITV